MLLAVSFNDTYSLLCISKNKFNNMKKDNLKNEQQCDIHDVVYNRYLENVKREEREKQVMLDLWYISTKDKQVVLCVTCG